MRGRELRNLVEDEAYSVVMVFSDGNRWQTADTQLIAGLAAGGPILWFDDRDRELWDSRLDPLRLAKIPIYEATGPANTVSGSTNNGGYASAGMTAMRTMWNSATIIEA